MVPCKNVTDIMQGLYFYTGRLGVGPGLTSLKYMIDLRDILNRLYRSRPGRLTPSLTRNAEHCSVVRNILWKFHSSELALYN